VATSVRVVRKLLIPRGADTSGVERVAHGPMTVCSFSIPTRTKQQR
jgi:hypothetical protein